MTIQPMPLGNSKIQMRQAVFGAPGTGKSTLALSYPRPVVIDTNHGLEGGAADGHEHVPVFRPTGHKDLTDIYFWGKDHADEFDTWVFDSGDTLIRLLMNEVVDKDEEPVGNYDIDLVPAIKDYLAVQKQVERILSDFRRQGKHMIVTFGARQETDKQGIPVGKRHASVSNGVLEVVNDWSNLIGELTVVRLNAAGEPDPKGEQHRVLFTDPSSKIRECRTRWEALLPHVLDPTFQVIWDKITTKEVK